MNVQQEYDLLVAKWAIDMVNQHSLDVLIRYVQNLTKQSCKAMKVYNFDKAIDSLRKAVAIQSVLLANQDKAMES